MQQIIANAGRLEETTSLNAMDQLVGLLCSEVQIGTPEHQDLHKEVTEVFSEHCLSEVIAITEPKPHKPGM